MPEAMETTQPILDAGPAPHEAPNPKPLLMIAAPKAEDMVDKDTGIMIDALPYIDLQYNDGELSAQVDALITEEMVSSKKTPDDFLETLKVADYDCNFKESPFLQSQWDRIQRGAASTPLDRSRYQVLPPAESERDSLEAWQKAVDNAHAQLESQQLRLTNLELLSKYGANAWRTHNTDLEAMLQSKQTAVVDVRQNIENLNRKRKAAQLSAGDKIRSLEGRFHKYIRKTNEMEAACTVLEREVRRLRKRANKRGLLKEGEKTAKKAAAKMDTTN